MELHDPIKATTVDYLIKSIPVDLSKAMQQVESLKEKHKDNLAVRKIINDFSSIIFDPTTFHRLGAEEKSLLITMLHREDSLCTHEERNCVCDECLTTIFCTPEGLLLVNLYWILLSFEVTRWAIGAVRHSITEEAICEAVIHDETQKKIDKLMAYYKFISDSDKNNNTGLSKRQLEFLKEVLYEVDETHTYQGFSTEDLMIEACRAAMSS